MANAGKSVLFVKCSAQPDRKHIRRGRASTVIGTWSWVKNINVTTTSAIDIDNEPMWAKVFNTLWIGIIPLRYIPNTSCTNPNFEQCAHQY